MDGSRRKFDKQTSIAGMVTVMGGTSSLLAVGLDPAGTPAIPGGLSACDKAKCTKWPIWIWRQMKSVCLKYCKAECGRVMQP